MSHILAIIYFALYAIAWPIYLSGRVRGTLLLLCIGMPVVSFFFGQYAA